MRSLAWIAWLPCMAALAAENDELPKVDTPTVVERASDAAGFAPPGWKVERTVHGDLDGDGRDDLLVVLHMEAAANVVPNDGLGPEVFDTNPRLLLVALAEGAGYRLAFQDDALIPRPESPVMDDFLHGDDAVGIARGAFSVTLNLWSSAGSWSTRKTRFTFRQQDGCFRLIGYDDDWGHRGTGETRNLSINYLTGKARIDTGTMENEAANTRWEKLRKAKPRCIAQVGNGFDFDTGLEPR